MPLSLRAFPLHAVPAHARKTALSQHRRAARVAMPAATNARLRHHLVGDSMSVLKNFPALPALRVLGLFSWVVVGVARILCDMNV